MKLTDLLKKVPRLEIRGSVEREIREVHQNSKKIEKGDVFVAVKGTQTDGHQFIDKAINNGADVVVCEQLPSMPDPEITFVLVENSQREFSLIMSNYYGNPTEKLIVVGVTGTNGKSTAVNLLHQIFQSMGYTSGMISTIHNKIGHEISPSTHTTPGPGQLQRLFAQMVEYGCEYCFMEVSSHSLVQHRVTGVPFKLAMFTNITHDHLDYHGSFDEYIRAKKILFDHLTPEAISLINSDDRNAKVMVQNTDSQVKRFALKRMADYKARILENTFTGLLLEIDGEEVWFRLLGSFNAYNILMVYAAAVELGADKQEVLKYLSAVQGVNGRFEVIRAPKSRITGIVDYAHTPDALQNVLSTISNINQSGAKVITVVGCGGDRDKTKRPVMARIAVDLSDQVILTSDNPRTENPETILDQMMEGVPVSLRKKVLRLENRKEAIRTATRLADRDSVILVAGKGHEDYQEIQGVKYPFDDRKVLQEALIESNE